MASQEFNRCALGAGVFLSFCGLMIPSADANPNGGTVSQGSASFTSSGSQLTIHTSDRAAINWQSFNIGAGQTTTFVQPSASSVVWNKINDSNPSQILGNLNANGYVVLQNQSGFFIGGQAVINTHGLLMTTSPMSVPDLMSGGAWSFNAPPPTASIINYGQINIGGGGSAFIIANDIQNHGTISAPGGEVGLFAGKEVLVSERPDGRGLSAQVTLPQGSVDNDGKIIADGGTIALRAQVVNQGGLIQANSVKEVNGAIELIASDAINLSAESTITAHGDAIGKSAGGDVTIKSGGGFSDIAGSTIDISGGKKAGNGGNLEISAADLGGIFSSIHAGASKGFQGGKFLIDPTDLALTSTFVSSLTPILSSGLYSIDLQADNNITLSTIWTLTDPGASALLKLTAGNNIVFNNGSGIRAGNNWSVNLSAGPKNLASSPAAGTDSITLNGNSFIDALNGNITLFAARDITVNTGAIRTRAGGSINVAAQFGDINTGRNVNGYTFGQAAAPYYRVNAANLGGISTAAGGDVTLAAGRDVISYLPTQSDYANGKFDGGAGAFGAQAGNVTITAGRDVLGHYVLGNGNGSITAGRNIGVVSGSTSGFALSLIKGGWNVQAPNGSIYVQDVRNPNGIFGERPNATPINYAGYHYVDYDSLASLTLRAGNSVEFTGYDMPHTPSTVGTIPIILPPILNITADSGNLVLDTSLILFPSINQDLKINTGGDFRGIAGIDGVAPMLSMSDSGGHRWENTDSFATGDHASTPPLLNNEDPVEITVNGNLQNVSLYTTKETHIKVHGDMIDTSFAGENLHAADVTSIHVDGAIRNSPLYTFVKLDGPITSANPLQPGAWDSVFALALNPDMVGSLANVNANNLPLGQSLADFLKQKGYLLFPSDVGNVQFGVNPGFVYVSSGNQLGFKGNMAAALASGLLTAKQLGALEAGQFTVLKADANGKPIVDATGHLQTINYTFGGASKVASLYTESLKAAVAIDPGSGLQIGGPGKFDIHAASLDLGNTIGIISWGIAEGLGGQVRSYSSLAGLTSEGASVNVDVDGNISMFTSTIASLFGGDVTVHAGGKIDLSLADIAFNPSKSGYMCYGVYTSGRSDVSVTADDDININNSRIAAFNGGNVFVKSFEGDVNAGTGANDALYVPVIYRNSQGDWISGQIGNPANALSIKEDPTPYGSGILAFVPIAKYQPEGGNGRPGNILVETPRGDIISTLGGIAQLALNGNIDGGPTVTLNAGTPPSNGSPGYAGNVKLGLGGVIGGTVNVTAQGDVQGLIISKQDANVSATANVTVTVFSGGTANVSAGGAISGTLVGVGGVSASGGDVTATILSQNVSVGGQQQESTLGTSASASATSQSAANQASNDAKEQVASDDTEKQDEKKKTRQSAGLTRRVGRVTVILPKAL